MILICPRSHDNNNRIDEIRNRANQIFSSGDEVLTLHKLWEYCLANPEKKVIYMHSKGTFHPHAANDQLRNFLMEGIFSPECTHLPDSCNVCSSRASPEPHPHISGNMWLARCNYVQKLMDPFMFENAMQRRHIHIHTYIQVRSIPDCCEGSGRYSQEHWILSHPDHMMCDLFPSESYTWIYEGVPPPRFSKVVKPFPRFRKSSFVKPKHFCRPSTLTQRLVEYKALYSTKPTSLWWGWTYFNATN